MPQDSILTGIVALLGTALVVSWLFHTLRLPLMLGFLFTGLLIGPTGLGLVDASLVPGLAELGLVLLLFVVGLELSPKPLRRGGRTLLVATAGQFLSTAAVGAVGAAVWGGVPALPAAFLGIAVAASSTAIVFRQLYARGEMRSAAGMIASGILLLQDVLIIGVMVVLPLVEHTPGVPWTSTLLRTGLSLVTLVLAAALAYLALPVVLRRFVRPGGREFLALFAVLVASAGALLAGSLGWSFALGSFLAGLLLSNSEARHQLLADLSPLRDVFNALFFISLGMLVDLDTVARHAPALGLAVAAVLGLKFLLAALSIRGAGWPVRPAVIAGLGLCSISEFGYLLVYEGHGRGLFSAEVFEVFTALAVGAMMGGALLLPLGDRIAMLASKRRARSPQPQAAAGDAGAASGALAGHLILVGYGTNGQNLVRALQAVGLPHSVVEMNPRLVEAAQAAGAAVVVGDASRESVLREAGLDRARGLVVAINDVRATQRIVAQARALRPGLYILARADSLRTIEPLRQAGADEVIPEDFEASIEMVAQTLKRFGYPDNVVESRIAKVRAERYGGALRQEEEGTLERRDFVKVLGAAATATVVLEEDNAACGQDLRELNLRARTGVTVIAVVRQGKPTTNPPPDHRLQAGDVLVLLGSAQQLQQGRRTLAQKASPVT
jgi:CPA2 family monovalent cation:H+ antiporter-2